jgi:hypothetical protein
MTLLMNHGWLAGLLVMFVYLIIGRVRMRAMIADGALTDLDANRFCIKAAVVLAVVFGLFEVVTLLSGLPLICQALLPITHPSVWRSYGLTVLCGGAFLFWVWKGGGDRTLAKVGPAFSRGRTRKTRYTPERVRFWSTATIVIAWGGYTAMRFTMPMPMPTHPDMPSCERNLTGR